MYCVLIFVPYQKHLYFELPPIFSTSRLHHMCGIAGWVSYQDNIDEHLFTKMRDTIAHRGPDDAANYYSEKTNVILGHRRLSFLDLSESGRQPMCNENGTLWVILNGEIYNYSELRTELVALGHTFKSTSDTEVLLHGFEQWGVDDLLQKIKGMFAFAMLDEANHKLYLVRDRFGIKPLYYFKKGSHFIFASELKAILKSGIPAKEIDFSSFADYFVYRYIPSPKTIWKDTYKLPPAHYLKVDLQSKSTNISEYWTLNSTDLSTNSNQLAEEIGGMLADSINIHSRSDVEIGSFLSGGYDSSAIVYYLSQQKQNLKTFSIGFENWDNSEHQFAEIVSEQLKTEHFSKIVGSESLDVLGKLSTIYDEPIADISIIPTYIVSGLAASEVKAVMSGEGADELFGGYEWQKTYYAQWNPSSLPGKLKNLFCNRRNSAVDEYAEYMAMGRFNLNELSGALNPDLRSEINSDTDWFYRQHYNGSLSPLKSIQKMDIKCFMGELVLTKIDRASMAHSLEVRVPFLDHELFEKVFTFKESVYFKPNVTKFLLHENIKNKLPKKILERKKQGFVGPDSYYMDIEWYKNIILPGKLLSEQVLNKEYINKLINEKAHWRLWKIAVMENWWQRWV